VGGGGGFFGGGGCVGGGVVNHKKKQSPNSLDRILVPLASVFRRLFLPLFLAIGGDTNGWRCPVVWCVMEPAPPALTVRFQVAAFVFFCLLKIPFCDGDFERPAGIDIFPAEHYGCFFSLHSSMQTFLRSLLSFLLEDG